MLPTRGVDDFVALHEAARHAIHSFETLSVSVETFESLQQVAEDLSNEVMTASGMPVPILHDVTAQLQSQGRMLRNLLSRCQSNKERLQNEIALVSDSKKHSDFLVAYS